MHLKDYHRKVLLGEIKDDEGEEKKEKTFVEEQNDLKKEFIVIIITIFNYIICKISFIMSFIENF